MKALEFELSLTEAFTAGRATSLHVTEAFELVVAETSAVLGFCPDTEEDVRSWLEPPAESKSAGLLVWSRDNGSLAQWWAGFQEPGGSNFFIGVRTHPRVPESVGDEMTRAAYETLLNWVRSEAGEDQGEVKVLSGCTTGHTVAARRLRAAGFGHERTFWEMRGAVVDSTDPPSVEGLTLTTATDLETVHRILTDAFLGHWGYEATPLQGWLAMEKSAAGYDPGLWIMADINGTPAAVMILSRRSAAEGALYVQELATLAPYRRRGIASALLRRAFDIARAEGYGHAILDVDSENSNAAPAVYLAAGFDVRSAFDMHTLTLTRWRTSPGG
jgi:ribosomal protein S18 acetylase RimI-like enzyme